MQSETIKLIIDSFPKILLFGIATTIPLTIISFLFALIIGIIIALMQFSNNNFLKGIARFYVWIIRGTPILVQLFIVFYGLPRIGILIDPFPSAVLVFSLNEGAYSSETIRASLQAIPKGQLEAAYCIGMTFPQAICRIILPQAIRIAFPPLSNSIISMVKDTSLVSNITVTEMLMMTQRIISVTYEPFILYLEVGFIYLIFSTLLTFLQSKLEKAFPIYK